MMLRRAARLAPAVAFATAALLAGLVSQAPAANGVQLADGTSLVEADPNAPDPVETIESDTLPFNATASSSSSFAHQQTTFVDSGTGITLDSASNLSGSDLDFAFTQMVRRFTVTAPSLPVKISGLVDDSGTGGGGDWLQTVVFREVGGADLFAFNDDDDDDFAEQGELAPGTYELEILGECAPGSGENCTADVSAHLELGQACSSSEVTVGFARAQGCFTETATGSGIFETAQKAWVGGFEIVPRAGGRLVLNTNTRDVSTSGAGADIVFAGFRVPIPVSALPVNTAQATVSFGGGAGTLAQVLDIPVEASVKVRWTDGGRSATYEQKVGLKKLTESIGPMVTPPGTVIGDFGGALKAKLENGVGFVLQQAEVSISKLTLLPRALRIPKKLELRDLLLRFERKDNKPFWTGRAGITLPFRDGLGVTGTVFVFDGSPAGGGLAVTGINKQLGGTPLFLQDVSGDLLFAPRFGHDLAIKGSLGPRVGGKQLLTISGQMKGGELITSSDCPSGDDPQRLLLSSKLTPLEPLELAGLASSTMSFRSCVYPYAGLVPAMDVTGTLGIDFANGALAYETSTTGFISDRGANLEGAATLKIPGLPNLNGSAIVSTLGTAACATVGFFDAGFGHRWGGGVPSAFTGCDLAPFRVTARARAADAHAAGTGTIEVPKGLPHAGFAATAGGGAPRVTVSGPGGFQLSSPTDGSVLRTPEALIVPVANERTTYVFVDDPRPGAWSVDSTDPANPLTKVGFAEGLDDPKVKAKVAKPRKKGKKGKGAKKFKLAYKLKRIPGQEVTFTERGAGIAQELGTARGRQGSISFKPTIAADRKRTIEAEVVQDGLPRDLVDVARFKAPPQPKIKKPKVKAKRKQTSLKLSWRRVKGAAEYLVEVSAGSEVLHRVITPQRKLLLEDTPAEGRLKATIQALGEVQPPGPIKKLKVKPPR